MPMPKVSVVIPCYNVEKYLRECMDSVVNQTLKDIEIICVNDGSTDTTLSILQEYADRDNRIRIIDKKNSGYGDSMNCGFDVANGDYLGIVESDDFAEPDMFERLYESAAKHQLDVCKAGFFQYSTLPEIKNVPILSAAKIAGKNIFCPTTGFQSPRRQAAFFKATAAIWAGIYRREFIRENHIRFNPTPGASYQDVGFSFKVWAKAKRVLFLDRCLLHYRVDNAGSSVHSSGKVYCICDEFAEINRFLQTDPAQQELLLPVMVSSKYDSYIWNYERLTGAFQAEFLHWFHKEFCQHQHDGTLKRQYFSWYSWNNLQKLLLDPNHYHDIQSRKLAGESVEDFYDAYPDHRPIKGKLPYYFAENIAGAIHSLNEFGISFVVNLLIGKMKQKIASLKEKEKV